MQECKIYNIIEIILLIKIGITSLRSEWKQCKTEKTNSIQDRLDKVRKEFKKSSSITKSLNRITSDIVKRRGRTNKKVRERKRYEKKEEEIERKGER